MRTFLLAVLSLFAICEGASAQEPWWRVPNWEQNTIGGAQFWADVHFFHQWHIQRSSVTGHYRLLDAENRRQAWGDYATCLERLEELKEANHMEPMEGRVLLLLHGLGGWSSQLESLGKTIEENSDMEVICVGYPSTRGDLATHAETLARVIESLEGIDEINFVAHSLGNLVVRHYLADTTDPETGRQGDGRLGRFVMLGPPNQGAKLADRLADNDFSEFFAGSAARQLTSDCWEETLQDLATPQCPFGIIAGGGEEEIASPPWVEGESDFIVAVDETKLAGASDFRVLPVLHFFMSEDTVVQEQTLRFLEHGFFESAETRNLLTADDIESGDE